MKILLGITTVLAVGVIIRTVILLINDKNNSKNTRSRRR